MDDAAAMEFYRDPANLEPAGPGHRRKGPRKTSMVAVRFDPAVVERCRAAAQDDGMAVSTWIRRAVARELEKAAREHGHESEVVPGSGRLVEPRHIPSSPRTPRAGTRTTTSGLPTTARCRHVAIGGVLTASCGICGPMAVEYVMTA